jgi:glutaredoxin
MITIYSKPACTHCDQAKALLKSKGIAFEEIHLDVGQAKTADAKYISRQSLLEKFPTARTMPQITDEGVYIGGFSELKSYFAERAQ